MTNAVLRQQLSEAATLAGYHDLFFLFAALTFGSLVPVIFLRGAKRHVARVDGTEGKQGELRQPSQPPVHRSH